MLCQNQTALGKTKTEIHVESPDTSLNTLRKMAVINGGHEKRAGKMLKKLERNVSYTHSACYNNSETFCSSSCSGSLRFPQDYKLPSKTLLAFSGVGIAFPAVCSYFLTSSSAGSSHRCSFSPVLVCLLIYSHRPYSTSKWHQTTSIFSSNESP